tara:strand:- start:395 stop:877 length:483 start_codon:yes stop_codon:yes gene_type:complete
MPAPAALAGLGGWKGAAILGGMDFLSGMFGGHAADKRAADALAVAQQGQINNIMHNRDMAKMSAGMQMWGNRANERAAKSNLGLQKEAALWDAYELKPAQATAAANAFGKMVGAESTPEATRLRKRKMMEEAAAQFLSRNADMNKYGQTYDFDLMKSYLT